MGLTNRFALPPRSNQSVLGPLLPHNWNPYPSYMEALPQWWGSHMGDSKILGNWSRANHMLHIKCLELKTISLSPHWASVTAPPGHDCYGQYQGSIIYQQVGAQFYSLLCELVDLFLWLLSQDTVLWARHIQMLLKCEFSEKDSLQPLGDPQQTAGMAIGGFTFLAGLRNKELFCLVPQLLK